MSKLKPQNPAQRGQNLKSKTIYSRKRHRWVIFLFKITGRLLIFFSVLGLVFIFAPPFSQEIKYRIEKAQKITYKIEKQRSNSSELGKLIAKPREKILVPRSTDFSIIIPKIGASEQVFANIDPSNEKEYFEALKKGVAHARGTFFPGMNGNIYLFAHSTDSFWNISRYNAVFYLLKNLAPGDDVIIFFQDKRYNYKVTGAKILEANDISYLEPNPEQEEILILQTCWPPGTTLKRLVILAKPANNN